MEQAQTQKTHTKKKTVLLVLVLSLILGLLFSGIVLAFYLHTDRVTNKSSASSMSIQLLEPSWTDGGGETLAKKLQPGMTIPKDPYVVNKSKAGVYVRMQLNLTDADDKAITGTRYDAIVSALFYGIENTAAFYENGSYQNPAFQYYEGYFYWIESTDNCRILMPDDQTDRLFTQLQVPILSAEYDGYFDSDFNINVEAEAIPATEITGDATVIAVAAKFAENQESTQ
jgi:flagellar basal body-associated protein FliL